MMPKCLSDSLEASVYSCILMSFHRIQHTPKQVAEPHGDHAEGDGKQNVSAGIKPFAVAQEIQGLQAEGGESGVAAANAGDEELNREGARLGSHFSLRRGERAKDADDERAGDVDDEGAPGKRLSEFIRDEAAKAVAGHAAERSADCDPKICEHKIPANVGSLVGVISAETVRRFSLSGGQTPLPCYSYWQTEVLAIENR